MNPFKSNHQRLFFSLFLVCCLVCTFPLHTNAWEMDTKQVLTIEEEYTFSTPQIITAQENVNIVLPDANSKSTTPGNPLLPSITKVFELPKGSTVEAITVVPSQIHSIQLNKPIDSVPAFYSINGDKTLGRTEPNREIYTSNTLYPSSWYDIRQGVGLNKDNKHVLFLSIELYPIRYTPNQNCITYVESMSLTLSYSQTPLTCSVLEDSYDLIIITPSKYQNTLTPLVDHKALFGVTTYVKTLEDIYVEYSGRDNPEKIKYFVKDAVEQWNATYLLLIGDMKTLPIRQADSYPWDDFHGSGLLTDLYYADIYNSEFEFASWDTNNNGVYGEIDFSDMHSFPIDEDQVIDKADLYADIHVGRIPCTTASELSTVINKIITYENYTYDQIWFQKIILIGGDTFPLTKGSPPFQYEGEITNIKVAQQLPTFEKEYLWASNHNLNARTFNKAISRGAGFVSYAGHGFEHGWGTYRPNAIIDKRLIFYYTPFLDALQNAHKLPIVFLDACLTAKMDFNISDLIDYYRIIAPLYNGLFGHYTPDIHFPSFAWYFVKLEDGGAIATIGATRPAYTWVDMDGVYAGAGYLDVHFFKSYEEGITAGQMLTQAQQDYLNYAFKDYFTIEEYLLFGDPSLRVGGYP